MFSCSLPAYTLNFLSLIHIFTLTSLAVAAIAGIVLNAILPGNDFHFGKSESGDDVASLGRY